MAHGMIKTVLGSPLWAAQIASGGKSFADNPLIGSPTLNRHGLYRQRLRLGAAMARRRRAGLAAMVDRADLAQFAEQGFVAIPDMLPPALFANIRKGLETGRFPARAMGQGDAVTRRMAIDPAMLKAIPALADLLAHPRWRGLTRYIASFDSEPVNYVQTILSHRIQAPRDPQTFLHADTFHPTMKAWLFLTDVTEDEGPFTYVPGSHRLTPARLAWEDARALTPVEQMDRLSSRGSLRIDAADLPALNLGPPRALAVRANTLVVADTFGFHARGLSAHPATRVEIWAYGRRNPFLPWAGLDPFAWGPFIHRRVPLLWSLRDRLETMIGQPWKPVGLKTAFED